MSPEEIVRTFCRARRAARSESAVAPDRPGSCNYPIRLGLAGDRGNRRPPCKRLFGRLFESPAGYVGLSTFVRDPLIETGAPLVSNIEAVVCSRDFTLHRALILLSGQYDRAPGVPDRSERYLLYTFDIFFIIMIYSLSGISHYSAITFESLYLILPFTKITDNLFVIIDNVSQEMHL